jgi:hypothetical protein
MVAATPACPTCDSQNRTRQVSRTTPEGKSRSLESLHEFGGEFWQSIIIVGSYGARVVPEFSFRLYPKRFSYRAMASSAVSISGLRPDSKSASTRAEPHAMVQPSVPCPVLRWRLA